MRRPTLKILVAVAGPLVVSGCASSGMTAAVSDPAAGFGAVQARTFNSLLQLAFVGTTGLARK